MRWGRLFDLHAGPHALEALNNHAIPGRKSRSDKPFVGNGSVERQFPLLGDPICVHSPGDRFALGVTRHRLLRNQDGLGVDALSDDYPYEHARQ
ncbi:hypothetical protein SDC9_189514 [bioreactor metagenome]|uniref:Uncharacterized protein n=1 Tax=bioreactor metagenome TaxID=1076179 RepID=A0A645HUU2_9ZZZZ